MFINGTIVQAATVTLMTVVQAIHDQLERGLPADAVWLGASEWRQLLADLPPSLYVNTDVRMSQLTVWGVPVMMGQPPGGFLPDVPA